MLEIVHQIGPKAFAGLIGYSQLAAQKAFDCRAALRARMGQSTGLSNPQWPAYSACSQHMFTAIAYSTVGEVVGAPGK